MMYETTEICPHCEREITVNWDTEHDGYRIYCPSCGKQMMLCDACFNGEDNPERICDWRPGEGCFRTKVKKDLPEDFVVLKDEMETPVRWEALLSLLGCPKETKWIKFKKCSFEYRV